MKAILAITLIVATSLVLAATPPAVLEVKGVVVEVKNVESFTYLRLKTSGCKWRRKKEPRGGVVEASPDA